MPTLVKSPPPSSTVLCIQATQPSSSSPPAEAPLSHDAINKTTVRSHREKARAWPATSDKFQWPFERLHDDIAVAPSPPRRDAHAPPRPPRAKPHVQESLRAATQAQSGPKDGPAQNIPNIEELQ